MHKMERYGRCEDVYSQKSRFVMSRYDQWKLGNPSDLVVPNAQDIPAIIAVGGGKGGVGKSVISANLATMLSRAGSRVLVVDLDLGCSNLHTHFGISMPKRSLADFLLKDNVSFKDILLPAPSPGVAFAAGGREEKWEYHIENHRKIMGRLWNAILASRKDFNIDFVIFDLGAGVHKLTMDFFTAAHLGIVTVLPEPTSIENAYAFLKIALWKYVENVGEQVSNPQIANDVKESLAEVGLDSVNRGYVDCFRNLRPSYPCFIQSLSSAILGRAIGIVVNQTREQSDIDIGKSMEHICQRYFGLTTHFLGYLNYDECVWKSLRNRRLLVSDFPHSLITKKFSSIASNIMSLLGINGV